MASDGGQRRSNPVLELSTKATLPCRCLCESQGIDIYVHAMENKPFL